MSFSGKRAAQNRIYFGSGALRKTVGLSQGAHSAKDMEKA